MRADRLLSIMMLLQARGQMTAQALAGALEVSERTIYRDIDALGAAGVPVYTEAGPGGGIGLLDSYRTTLTGLTDGEVRALFAASVTDSLAALGIDDELRSALRKLAAALPAVRRTGDMLAAEVYFDATSWGDDDEPVPHLSALHRAIRTHHRVQIRYRRFSGLELAATVEPLGLVVKAGAWVLAYARADRLWAMAIADVLDVQVTEEEFAPPLGFDLRTFWQAWSASAAAQQASYVVTVRVAPAAQPVLARLVGGAGGRRMAANAPDAGGWVTMTLAFPSLDAARAALLALGRGVEVIAPEPLRRSLLDYAEQIVALYGGRP